MLNKKGINDYLSQVKRQVGEIKSSNIFIDEFKKPKSGVNFNDDIIYTTKHLSEEFKKSQNATEIFDAFRKNKKVDVRILDGINLNNIASSRPVDAVLYNMSLIKYEMANGYYSKALSSINNSLEILNESKISNMDSLAIALRLDKSYIEAHTVDNYSALKENIMKEIVNGYVVDDPSIIVTGFLYLIKFFYYFNFFFQIPALLHLTYDVSNKTRINNVHVSDTLINTYVLNQFKKSKNSKFVARHSNPNKMGVLTDLREKIEIYSNEPGKYYSLLQQLDRTLKYYQSNYPNDPSIWQFHVKRWVIETQLGREATAEHNLDLARNFLTEHFSLAESYVHNEFNRDSVYECFSYQNYYLASDFIKKNVKSGGKNHHLNLLYKSFNLQVAANLKAESKEVVDKLDDFCRAHDKFFPTDVREFKSTTLEIIRSLGYSNVVDALENKKKKKIEELV